MLWSRDSRIGRRRSCRVWTRLWASWCASDGMPMQGAGGCLRTDAEHGRNEPMCSREISPKPAIFPEAEDIPGLIPDPSLHPSLNRVRWPHFEGAGMHLYCFATSTQPKAQHSTFSVPFFATTCPPHSSPMSSTRAPLPSIARVLSASNQALVLRGPSVLETGADMPSNVITGALLVRVRALDDFNQTQILTSLTTE
jgi:hypothetical protein